MHRVLFFQIAPNSTSTLQESPAAIVTMPPNQSKEDNKLEELVTVPSGPGSEVQLPQDAKTGSSGKEEHTKPGEFLGSKTKSQVRNSSDSADKTAEEPKTSIEGKSPSTFNPGNVENIYKFGSFPVTKQTQPCSTKDTTPEMYQRGSFPNAGPSREINIVSAPVANLFLQSTEQPAADSSTAKPNPLTREETRAPKGPITLRKAYMKDLPAFELSDTDDTAPPRTSHQKFAQRAQRKDHGRRASAGAEGGGARVSSI